MAFFFKLIDTATLDQGEYRKTSWAEARNVALGCAEAGLRYFVQGREVDRRAFLDATYEVEEVAFEKKNKTHKQITISHGVCAGRSTNAKSTIWVRR